MSEPKLGKLLLRGITKKCPACGQGKLFTRWFNLAEDCPRCGLHFERIEGHWMGAIGLNTIITFATLLVVLVTALIVTKAATDWRVFGPAVASAAIVPILISPTCRTLWTAIDIAMRKLGPDEVDWQMVDGASGQGATVAPSSTRESTP